MKIECGEFITLVNQNVSGLQIDEVRSGDRLSDIGLDSLGFVSLIWAIEDKYKIQIDDKYLEKLNNMSTISDFISMLNCVGCEVEV